MLDLVDLIELVELHGVNGQTIHLNPRTIVTMRLPRQTDHFPAGVRCYISTADGKAVMVVEPCTRVRALLEGKGE